MLKLEEEEIEVIEEDRIEVIGEENRGIIKTLCLTATDSYKPTQAEERLLMALADPSNRLLSVSEVCRVANISRDTYYKAFAKPEFQDLNIKLGLELIKRHAQPLINVTMKFAKEGSYKHLEALLKMGGLLTDKQEIKHIHSIEQQLAELDD